MGAPAQVAPGVFVFTSRVREAVEMSSLLVLRDGGGPSSGALLVDPGFLPDELEALGRLAGERGEAITHLVLTHSHWDHVAGACFFASRGRRPEVIASTSFPRCLAALEQPGDAAAVSGTSNSSRIASIDREAGVQRNPPYSAPRPDRLIGEETFLDGTPLRVLAIPAPGHTADSLALLLPDEGVLIPGDSLSAIEIPYVDDTLEAARSTLDRFGRILRDGRAAIVVPSHGAPMPAERALEILEEDDAYLAAIQHGAARGDRHLLDRVVLPRAVSDPEVRRGHEENVRLALMRAGRPGGLG